MTPVRLANRVIGLFVVLGVTSPVSSTNIVYWGFDMAAEHNIRDHESQLDKFKALAREVEADEDEARWDERLKKVAAAKPEHEGEKPE